LTPVSADAAHDAAKRISALPEANADRALPDGKFLFQLVQIARANRLAAKGERPS
jgi:hypothetical protein